MKQIKCKFCKADVLYNYDRVFELDGKTLHVSRCERRKDFYKNEAAIRLESKRQEKPR